jgi:CRP-like cAMP-binding protein
VIGAILGQELVVYTMHKGECAGTRAFVDRTPRKATLRASGEALVYTMTPAAFESLLDKHPHIVYKVMRALFRITHSNLLRMRDESQELVNYVSKIHGRY